MHYFTHAQTGDAMLTSGSVHQKPCSSMESGDFLNWGNSSHSTMRDLFNSCLREDIIFMHHNSKLFFNSSIMNHLPEEHRSVPIFCEKCGQIAQHLATKHQLGACGLGMRSQRFCWLRKITASLWWLENERMGEKSLPTHRLQYCHAPERQQDTFSHYVNEPKITFKGEVANETESHEI